MAHKKHYNEKLDYGSFYHIYNRSIDRQLLFKSEENYLFFLNQYNKYLTPFVDTYAYCLLGNHFHFLIRIKEENPLNVFDINEKSAHDIIAHQLQKFFQSYAMAFNKQHKRIGSLFQKPFKRTWVDKEDYLIKIINYIHFNPQKHGLIDDFRNWKWSSYKRMLIDKPTSLKKEKVIEWFGDKEGYINFHNNMD